MVETIATEKSATERPARAPSLSVEDRQSMLIDVVTPLLLQHGRAVTTKQIAECAGIAEGTIFRAFGSKDELIRAAIDRHLDPEPFRAQLRLVDLDLPLEERITAIVTLMRERFTTVFTLMSALGATGPPPHSDDGRREFAEIISRSLAGDAARLNVDPARAAQIVRMIALAASVPQMRNGQSFDDGEIAALILYGIAGRPADRVSN
ncbi:TetR/AcrR family transcriptional regulator [Leifsonia kafniensis]|uniref:TetR/AcrR family transcriptional regulator n=1 Tax=Leifsonia kafniensis TaxID=475957 RepID=A0ABP7L753_9MICO